MAVNYQIEMEKLTDDLTQKGIRPKLLLNACCAPCSSAVLERIVPFFDVTVYWYNPNIAPFEEEEKRFNELPKLLKLAGHDLVNIIRESCEHDAYLEAVSGYENASEGGARCEKCFVLRLTKTAETAKKLGFDYFATTLTVSPHKNAELINKIGFEMQEKFGVNWLPSDFKKKNGYLRSIELSRLYGLYRQDYCGCEFAYRG